MDFDKLIDSWEAEKAFWAAEGRPKTWDIEDIGTGYSSYRDMVPCEHTGDWVRSEHYRTDVEALESKVRELQDRLTHYFPHSGSE
jgi:hypothetical protein